MLYRATLSSAFLLAGGLMLGSLMSVDSLVSHLSSDGQVHYFRDSTGSMSGQDDYLAFPILFLVPLLWRMGRPTARLNLAEVGLHILALGVIGIAISSVGIETLRQTRLYGGYASFPLALYSGMATCGLSALLLLDRILSRAFAHKATPKDT